MLPVGSLYLQVLHHDYIDRGCKPYLPTFQVIKQLMDMKRKKIQKVYPGLTCLRDGVRQIPIESIPGVIEAGFRANPNM